MFTKSVSKGDLTLTFGTEKHSGKNTNSNKLLPTAKAEAVSFTRHKHNAADTTIYLHIRKKYHISQTKCY